MRRVPTNRLESDHAFFVTMTTRSRRSLFLDPSAADTVMASLEFFRERKEIELYAFVVMPDHLHLILQPVAPLTLSAWIRRFKTYTTHELGPRPIWQSGCWSEIVEGQLFYQKMIYIHMNPVRAMLCETPEQFRWSSANEYWREKYDLISPP